MKQSEKQQTFSKNIAYLIFYANSIGIGLTFGDAYRSKEQQQIYMDKGLSWTMNSKHLERLAVDFNFFIDGELTYEYNKLKRLGEYWEDLNENNQWGGFWAKKDCPHFQTS